MSTPTLENETQTIKRTKAGRPKARGTKPPMVQMNVRIDAELKKQGDRALERVGLSPSEAVRALWECAVRHANDPNELRNLVNLISEPKNGKEGELATDKQNQRQALLEEGWALVDNFRKENGLLSAIPEDDDERMAYYDQLREEAYWDRLSERGLA